jgi:hypothetical protein
LSPKAADWYDAGEEGIMIELTPEQRQRLDLGQAVEIIDSETACPYVVLRKEVYDRVQRLLYDDSEWTEDELRAVLAQSSQGNGWDEPAMEAYDRYDEERSKRCP